MKIVVIFIVIAIAAIVGMVAHDNYESEQRKKMELEYNTKYKWKWHDEYNRIQIRFSETNNKSILRKVNINDRYIVYAMKDQDYSLLAFIEFIVPCKPNTSIETSEKFSSGEPIILKCNKEGTSLSYGAKWDGKDTDIVWSGNLDGFDFSVDFGRWDFTKLDQEITLSKAK